MEFEELSTFTQRASQELVDQLDAKLRKFNKINNLSKKDIVTVMGLMAGGISTSLLSSIVSIGATEEGKDFLRSVVLRVILQIVEDLKLCEVHHIQEQLRDHFSPTVN